MTIFLKSSASKCDACSANKDTRTITCVKCNGSKGPYAFCNTMPGLAHCVCMLYDPSRIAGAASPLPASVRPPFPLSFADCAF